MITASAIPASGEQTSPPPPSLLDALQQAAAERGISVETIRAYVDWTRRFIVFHGKRHPRDLTNAEVGRFLGHVAQTDKEGGKGRLLRRIRGSESFPSRSDGA
jgi:Phage integrase, N-terminal SAM-like domain